MTTRYDDYVLESDAVMKRLKQEAVVEASEGSPLHYWAVARRKHHGLVEVKNYQPNVLSIDPHPTQTHFAALLCRALHKHIDHGGGWIVGWTNPPPAWQLMKTDGDNVWARLFCLWLDEDGDPQFTFDSLHPVAEVVSRGVDYHVSQCEAAWREWKHMARDDLDLKDSQTYRAAAGEKPPAAA